jgi:hypothetical protein
MDRAFTYTVADLAPDESLRLPCACRPRVFTRAELVALVGADARLHLIGLHREVWCRECGEPPLTGEIVRVVVPLQRW